LSVRWRANAGFGVIRWTRGQKAFEEREEFDMGRYLLLWLIGVPLPILLLIWVFGGLH
jgi:hypothetical protein